MRSCEDTAIWQLMSEFVLCANEGCSCLGGQQCACKTVRYCSIECQRKDWKAGHRLTCPARKPAPPPASGPTPEPPSTTPPEPEPPDLKPGLRAHFLGLVGRTDLNGLLCDITRFREQQGRWEVRVVMTGEVVHARAIHLCLVKMPGTGTAKFMLTFRDDVEERMHAALNASASITKFKENPHNPLLPTVVTYEFCENEACKQVGQYACKRCGRVRYCCETCQREDWPRHKASCVKAVRPNIPPIPKRFSDAYFVPRPFDKDAAAAEDPQWWSIICSPHKDSKAYMVAMRAAVQKEPRFHLALKSLIARNEFGTGYIVGPVIAQTMGSDVGLSLMSSW